MMSGPDNTRAGVATFSAHVALGQSALACNAFDLDAESDAISPYTFEDLGENGCGCPEPAGNCVAQSVGLAPPEHRR